MSLRSKGAAATVPAGGRIDIVLLAGKLRRATLDTFGTKRKGDEFQDPRPIFNFFHGEVSLLASNAMPQITAAFPYPEQLAQVIAHLVSAVFYTKYMKMNTNLDREQDPELWTLVRDESQPQKFAGLLGPRFLPLIKESINSGAIHAFNPLGWGRSPGQLVRFADYLQEALQEARRIDAASVTPSPRWHLPPHHQGSATAETDRRPKQDECPRLS